MAKPKKLKVYRTPIGFHDAYVAAPSQKAALEAWGSDANLFTRGVAEIVTDDALTAEPLANPGTVVKRLRGTADEQIAEASKPAPAPKAESARRAKPKTKSRPRPSREAVDEAEADLEKAEDRNRKEQKAIKQKIAALDQDLSALRDSHAAENAKLEGKRDRALATCRRAMERWRQ